MSIRPFLCHQSLSSSDVQQLRLQLNLRGASAWKDTDDLLLGARTPQELRRVISDETEGFIWYGTRASLHSPTIREVEIPYAFQRLDRDSRYPLVPAFVDIHPKEDADEIVNALGDLGRKLLDQNGVIRQRRDSTRRFLGRLASRYVHDAILRFPTSHLTVAISTTRNLTYDPDLVFDWRTLFDADTRFLDSNHADLMKEILGGVRDALQGLDHAPKLILDLDTTLPIAMLIGYEWRVVTHIGLTVKQRTGTSYSYVEGDGPSGGRQAENSRRGLRTKGPVVVCVSCRSKIDGAANRYADTVKAREISAYHLDGLLSSEEIRSLARTVAFELSNLNDEGAEKHLLIKGPESLSLLIGAASNATGMTIVPFWDGNRYVSPITIGGSQSRRVHE